MLKRPEYNEYKGTGEAPDRPEDGSRVVRRALAREHVATIARSDSRRQPPGAPPRRSPAMARVGTAFDRAVPVMAQGGGDEAEHPPDSSRPTARARQLAGEPRVRSRREAWACFVFVLYLFNIHSICAGRCETHKGPRRCRRKIYDARQIIPFRPPFGLTGSPAGKSGVARPGPARDHESCDGGARRAMTRMEHPFVPDTRAGSLPIRETAPHGRGNVRRPSLFSAR